MSHVRKYEMILNNLSLLGLGSIVDVALASKAERRGFDPWLDAMFLTQHVDPPINWDVTWLWSTVKRLELHKMKRYINLHIYLCYLYIIAMCYM